MPAEGMRFAPRRELLTDDDIDQCLSLAMGTHESDAHLTLPQVLYAAGAAVYQQAAGAEAGGAAPGGNGTEAGGGSASDDVIDAEFTESK
jgi:hypothetical protein